MQALVPDCTVYVIIDSLLAMRCYVTSVCFIFLMDDTLNRHTCVKIIVTSQLTHVKSILLGTQNYSSSDGIFRYIFLVKLVYFNQKIQKLIAYQSFS